MSTISNIMAQLSAPFGADEIEWRLQQSGIGKTGLPWGKCLPYLTARAVQDRLDFVFGLDRWSASYSFENKGVICHLAVKFGNEWVIKSDGSELTDIEPFKGGISSAFKRAAVLWGIGRYLYSVGECWAQFDGVDNKTPGATAAKVKDKDKSIERWYYWLPPKLPDWALPNMKSN